MTAVLRILGIGAIVVVVAVGAAFATDALVGDGSTDESTSITAPTSVIDTMVAPISSSVSETDGDIPVRVVPAYWTDTSSDPDDPAPPPPVDDATAVQAASVAVMRPPSGEPTDHREIVDPEVDFAAEPIEIEELETEAVDETGDQQAPAAISPEQDVQVGVPIAVVAPRIRPVIRFIDPCAAFAGGACPFGLPALVVIGADQPEFQMAAAVSRGEEGRMMNGTAGCPADFVEGEYNLWIVTTVPTSVYIAYHQSVPPGLYTGISLQSLGPGDAEYDRWVENQSNGEFDANGTWTWFRRCFALDLEPNVFYEFSEVKAEAANGQVVIYDRPLSLGTVIPGENAGMPSPTFVYGDDSRLTVHVWKKSLEDGYRAFVWPIDLSEPDAASCAGVESDLFYEGGRIGASHPDFRVAAVSHPQQPATPNEIYDSDYVWTQQFDMALREGRQYTLCVWEARLGSASFDEWEIISRDQYDVVTPNSHPLVMTLVRTTLRGDTAPHKVHVYAENHDYCDVRASVLNATVEQRVEGTLIVREGFCESWGLPLDDFAFTRITIDDEVADVVALPLDPFINCGIGTSDPGCAIRVSEYITHTVEIPGSCALTCAWFDLKFRLDYLPSNGDGADSWRMGPAGTFEGMEQTVVAGPDVDVFSMTLEPISSRVDAMKATFELKSPSDYTISMVAPVRLRVDDESCNSVVSGSGEGRVEVVFDGLCPDTLYVLTSITLSDADGNTTDRDLVGTVPLVWTNGYASFFRTQVSMNVINLQEATAQCERTDDQGGFSRGAAEDCWNYFGVASSSPVLLGGSAAWALNFPSCVSPLGNLSAAWGAPPIGGVPPLSQAIVHGDSVELDIRMYIDVSTDCGSGGTSDGRFALLEIYRDMSLESLELGPIFTLTRGGVEWQVRVLRTDAGIANRRS